MHTQTVCLCAQSVIPWEMQGNALVPRNQRREEPSQRHSQASPELHFLVSLKQKCQSLVCNQQNSAGEPTAEILKRNYSLRFLNKALL